MPCWSLYRLIQEAYLVYADGTANFISITRLRQELGE